MKATAHVLAFVASICLLGLPPAGSEDTGPIDAKVRSLIGRLGSKEPKDAGVEHELALLGARAVPALTAALSSKDGRVRARAARTLGMIGNASPVPALLDMVRRKQSRYTSALHALGKIGGPDAATHLLAALPREPLRTRADIVRYLGLIGDNRAVAPLCALLEKSTSIRLRRRAAEALGRFRDPRSRDALRKTVDNDTNWDVYRAAKKSLLRQATGREPALPHQGLIEIVILKRPEPPEGAEKWLRRYAKAHPPSPLAPRRMGPTVHSFVIPARYKSARKKLLSLARHHTDATRLVEALLGHMRHRQLKAEGPDGKAMRLIIDIGKPAVPALENAVRRGDETLKTNATRCLRAIRGPQATTRDAVGKT